MTQPQLASSVAALCGVDGVAFELWGDGDEDWLLPDERPFVERAVPNRRRQFAAGRHCARLALAELGVEAGPIMVGERRSPQWPVGVTGSISHTEGYVVAVVAPLSDRQRSTIGIDAERVGRVDESLHRRLFIDDERARLRAAPVAAQAELATVGFGAKEAFYKAQFVRTEAWVGFHDVEVRLASDGHHAHTLHPATDLAVLDRFSWPVSARHLTRHDVAVAVVTAAPSPHGVVVR